MQAFLEAILPFLVIKKRQAEIVLEFLSTLRHVGRNRPLTEAEIERKLDLYYEIAALNERGL